MNEKIEEILESWLENDGEDTVRLTDQIHQAYLEDDWRKVPPEGEMPPVPYASPILVTAFETGCKVYRQWLLEQKMKDSKDGVIGKVPDLGSLDMRF